MGNVQFSGQNRDVPGYVLNSPKDNVFESHNIRFHIDGKYLTDFSDKGIERFIDKNYNNKTGFLGGLGLGWGGKDLELKEVKAFIQAAAANAEKLQGMTFELTDPQLGLFDDDDVKVEDIQHSFSMDYKPVQGTSAGEVSFVDATKVQYDIRDAKKTESTANDAYKSAQSTYRDLQKDLTSATKDRDKIASRIGDNAVQRLAEIDGKLKNFDSQLSSLNTDMQDARLRLSQDHIPDSERRELRLALRGMEMEKKDVESERNKVRKELSEKHGFWSFLGGGSNLEELRKANEAVEKASKAVEANRPSLDAARTRWQDAKKRLDAVEHGQSLADYDRSVAAPAAKPDAPAQQPAQPVQGPAQPAASQPANSAAGEKLLQQVLNLPAEKQLEALGQVPAGDRQSFLAMADEYLMAGRQDNPLGLDAPTFQTFSQSADLVAKVRNNALLSWGDDAQKAYFDRAGDAGAKEVLEQLNKQLFDQQLAAQAQALKARLQSRPQPQEEPIQPAAETTPVKPGQAQAAPAAQGPAPAQPAVATEPGQQPVQQPAQPAQPAQQPAAVEEPVLPGNRTNPVVSQQPAAPLTLEAFKALPPEQMLERFADLPAADQDLVFSGENLNTKGILLMQHASQHLEDQATRERLSKLLSPADKQDLVNQLDTIKQGANGTPYPHLTEVNSLLGMFAQQGVAPKAAPAQPAQSPAQPAQQPARPVVQDEAPAAASPKPVKPKTPAQPAQTAKPATPAKPKPAAPAPAPAKPAPAQPPAPASAEAKPLSQEDLAWAESLANKIEASKKTGKPYTPTAEEAARYTDIQTRYAASQENAASQPSVDDKVKALKGMEPIERMQAFSSLSVEGKKEVFGKLPLQMQTECLLSLAFPAPNDADRSSLVKSLSSSSKQALSKAYVDGLPAAAAVDADLKTAMEKLIRELGVKVSPAAAAAPAQAQSAPEAAVQVPPAPPAPPAPVSAPAAAASNRLDMSAQLKQLKSVLTEKSYWGWGSVTNPQNMNQLVDQIWGMGTDANRQEMAKLLVDNKQSTLLAQLLSNTQVDGTEAVKTLSAPGFPITTFMNAVDDSHAFLMLHSLAQVSTQNDAQGKRAAALISDTITAYQKGMDRETPFKRLKQAATAEQFWDQMPKAVRDKIENMFKTYWN